jgi:glutamate/tyrosine decarboxylase-like PLP-dependent enzyme
VKLPSHGLSDTEVLARIEAAGAGDLPWREGKGWSLVYDMAPDHAALIAAAEASYAEANALSHSAFPSVSHFESEVLAMVASVVSPGTSSYGVFTSSGTESILLALKAYRDSTSAERTEVVVPRTAHPAFGKAAQLLGLELRIVDVGASGRVDPAAIDAAAGPRTVVVGVSAPNFPFGVVDPVEAVAALTASRGIGVHVDAALGGLFLPFVDTWTRPFGLDVPGVTSVSVDLHKYGYSPKGSSALMFAGRELRHASYYVDPDWPGGSFASASTAGTRSGRVSAGAYASLLSLGRDGLRRQVADVLSTTRRLVDGLRSLGLEPVAVPDMSVFAVASDSVDVRSLAGGLQSRGWWMDVQPDPVALHFVVMPRHAHIVDQFLSDVAAVIADPPPTDAGSDTGAYGPMVRDSDADGDPRDVLREHLDGRYDSAP